VSTRGKSGLEFACVFATLPGLTTGAHCLREHRTPGRRELARLVNPKDEIRYRNKSESQNKSIRDNQNRICSYSISYLAQAGALWISKHAFRFREDIYELEDIWPSSKATPTATSPASGKVRRITVSARVDQTLKSANITTLSPWQTIEGPPPPEATPTARLQIDMIFEGFGESALAAPFGANRALRTVFARLGRLPLSMLVGGHQKLPQLER